MPRGPLPSKNARRTNKPTIPTRLLPPGGFAGPYPRPPRGARALGDAGKAWWHWAWRTPQAAAWTAGDLYTLARRASFEDDDAALLDIEGLDVSGALHLLGEKEEAKAVKELKWAADHLASMVGGRLALAQKMLDLDRQLGLTTKAFLDLRLEIGPGEKEPAPAPDPSGTVTPIRRRAVDPALAGGA